VFLKLAAAQEISCATWKAPEVTAIDINGEYLTVLSQTIRVPEGHALTVRNQNFLEDMTGLSGYDTVVLINVLEHVPDPEEALCRIHQMLMSGGHVVALVPALEFLHSHFDDLIGHYRRYTRKSLASGMRAAGFTMKKDIYFNLLGIGGWWCRFCLLKREYITRRSVRLFETVTPLLRAIESVVPPPVGSSVIADGRETAMKLASSVLLPQHLFRG
jgi:SAM-dependent methyltransferase